MALKRRIHPTEKSRLLETVEIVTLECPRCFRELEITFDKSKYPFEKLKIEKCFPVTTGENNVLARSTQKRNRGYRIRLSKGCHQYLIDG